MWIHHIERRSCDIEITLETPRFGDVKTLECVLRKAALRESNHSNRNNCASVNNAERSSRSEECFDIRTRHAEFGDFSCGFGFIELQYFLMLPLGMVNLEAHGMPLLT